MKTKLVSLVICTSCIPASLLALGIRVPDQDAYAIARGNAFVATADNPSAIYYNPAGITQLEGLQSRLGAYTISLGSEYTSPEGFQVETRERIQPVPYIYSTYSLKNLPLTLGFGSYSPYGLSLEWPEYSGFRTLARKGQITYINFNLVAAWKITDSLSIAAGPTINYSRAELIRGIAFAGDEFKFKGDDTDVAFNAGILWHPLEKHSFGVSYLSATAMNYDGHADTRLTVPRLIAFSEPATARFHFPQRIIAGWSFRPTPDWNLEFNADWTDWDSVDTVTLRKATGNVALPFNWTSSLLYEFGATRCLPHDWRVSAGYIYSENSVPDRSFNPSVPDSDRHILSVGVGGKYKRLNWDAAYQFAYGPTRTVTGGPVQPNPFVPGLKESADGQYEFTSHAFTFSIGFSF